MLSNILLELFFVLIIIYVFFRGKKSEKILVVCSILFFVINSFANGYYTSNVSGYLYSIVSGLAITIIFINTIKRKDFVWSIISFIVLLFLLINLITILLVMIL
jgi:hypothetical protein